MRPTEKQWWWAVLLVSCGVFAGTFLDTVTAPKVANAAGAQGVPDPAVQQIQTNEILRSIDARLAHLSAVVEGGVKVTQIEKK